MVFRLRLSYLLILIFVVGIGISSASQYRDISDRKADLTERAIPLLTLAQQLVALLSVQSEQIVALRYVDMNANFGEIARNLQSRQDQFDQTMRAYLDLSGDPALQSAASRLFASTASLIELKLQRQRLSQVRFRQLSALRAMVDQMDLQIEELRLDTLTKLQASVDQLGTGSEIVDRIGVLSSLLNTLISLELRLEQMLDIVENADINLDPVATDTVVEDLRFSLREIVAMMTRVPTSSLQQALAAELSDVHRLINDEGGVLANADRQAALQAEIDQAVASGITQIRLIEAQIAQTIIAADIDTQETSSLLDQSIRTVATTNLLLVVVFVGGFVLVTLILVELQLNRRIQSLIGSVRRFAAGHYTDDIAVTGADELGEIADALRLSQDVSRDLERSNLDLQSFAYAASHDLKTPLRAITDLAEWTLEDAREELSDENFKRLELLSNRSIRLSHLLDGLLLYARVDGMTDQDQAVNLDDECTAIADLLDPDGHYAVIVEDPELEFSTAIVPLRQILNNLISNAMKHHDKPTGTIWVRARTQGNIVEIEVEDDGPGIPQRFHQKIFELFQKLESRDVVEGAGIGLALVEKLAERHGGGIQLVPQQDGMRGCVFKFKLALARAA